MTLKHAVAPLIVLALIAAFWLSRRPSESGVIGVGAEVVGPGGQGVASAVGAAAHPAGVSDAAAPALAPAATKTARELSASPTTVSLPLPPLDAPLASTLDALRQRAAAGDARAACRVAAELRKCELVDVQLAFAQRMERARQQMESAPGQAAPEANARQRSMAPFVDSQYRDALAASEHCAGVPQTSSPGEQIRYWRQAALQGHLPSMAMYASGNVFRMRNTLSNLQDFEVYRHEAESLARRAALAGDSEALLALTRAYAPLHDQMVPSLLAQATGADVVEELSMLLLAQKRGISVASQRGRGPMFSANQNSLEAMIADARGRADAEQVSRAEQLAASRDAAQTLRETPAPAAFARERTTFDDERPRCGSEAFAPVAPSPASG